MIWESCATVHLGSAVAEVGKSGIHGTELRVYQLRSLLCAAMGDSSHKDYGNSITRWRRNLSLKTRIVDLPSHIRTPWLYQHLKEPAKGVKVLLQMIVGVVGVTVVLVAVLRDALGGTTALDSSKHALVLISVALAVAASLELAYTLFTPGPDEAVDPLILGISAIFLYLTSAQDNLTWTGEVAVVLFAITLGILFAVRQHFIDGDDVTEGQRGRRVAREKKIPAMTGSNPNKILLDLLELAEFAWPNRYQELGPSEEVVEQILRSSPNQLGEMVVLLRARLEDQ